MKFILMKFFIEIIVIKEEWLKTLPKVRWSQNVFMKSSIFQNTTEKIW